MFFNLPIIAIKKKVNHSTHTYILYVILSAIIKTLV
jgi:hypothetical protein